MTVDASQPELMFRAVDSLDFRTMTVVCGCGIRRHPQSAGKNIVNIRPSRY